MPRVRLDPKGQVVNETPPVPPESLQITQEDREPDDPMRQLFGPGSTMKLVGEAGDGMPEEVRNLLEEFGLAKQQFSVMLKSVLPGMEGEEPDGHNSQYITSWSRGVPSLEHIARNYGPGTYVLIFTWKDIDEQTGRRSKMCREPAYFTISDKIAGEFKKHQFKKKMQDASERGSEMHETLIEKKLESEMIKAMGGIEEEKKDPSVSAKDYIKDAFETVKMLGVPIGMAPAPKGIEWDKILPAVVPLFIAFMNNQQQQARQSQEQFEKMLMLMMTQSQTSANHLLEYMKTTSGNNSQAAQIKETRDMIFGMLDIKNAIAGTQPEKETIADKIFRVIEGVAPQIFAIAAAAKNPQTAAQNPLVIGAKAYVNADPNFQQLQRDPAEMKKEIELLDETYGWKQTDFILDTIGWNRPPECPRDPAKELPIDQRNTPAEEHLAGMTPPSQEEEIVEP